MKRAAKKSGRARGPRLTAAERAVEEIRAIRRQLLKEAGGKYRGVVEIGKREGSLAASARGKRRSA